MSCPDTRIQPEPPPPARAPYAGPGASFFVTGCLNCKHCHDGGAPHKPEQWICLRDEGEGQGVLRCHEARNIPNLCGLGAKWYVDALGGR